jgi:hypothetical protein
LKILRWTNRDLSLRAFVLPSAFDGKPQVKEREWVACGRTGPSEKQELDNVDVSVVIESIPPQSSEEPHSIVDQTKLQGSTVLSVTVSLTRTRWCTRIKKDLMETIKSRRVD